MNGLLAIAATLIGGALLGDLVADAPFAGAAGSLYALAVLAAVGSARGGDL